MPGVLQVKLAKNSNAKPSSLQGSSPVQTTLTLYIFLPHATRIAIKPPKCQAPHRLGRSQQPRCWISKHCHANHVLFAPTKMICRAIPSAEQCSCVLGAKGVVY